MFHKGTAVRLDVSGIPDPAEEAKATEALTKKLTALNCAIDPAAEVAVVALVEGPKSREVHYMHSGAYQVQEYFTRLKFVYQDQTLWETQYTNIPHVLSLKRDENVEGVLRKLVPALLRIVRERGPSRVSAKTRGQKQARRRTNARHVSIDAAGTSLRLRQIFHCAPDSRRTIQTWRPIPRCRCHQQSRRSPESMIVPWRPTIRRNVVFRQGLWSREKIAPCIGFLNFASTRLTTAITLSASSGIACISRWPVLASANAN